jgi:hypothetical protein
MGKTDCNITVAKTPAVATTKTMGKPTTNKQTKRVKVQTEKLFMRTSV